MTLLEVKYDKRIAPSLGVEAEDLDAEMTEFLPPGTFRDRSQWEKKRRDKSIRFRPLGKAVATYEAQGKTCTIYKSSLADPDIRPHLERMQIFSILFIEGASLIDVEDDRFDLYTIYSEESDGVYEFIGYCTCYKYNFYDRYMHSFDYVRYRISQLIILPNHQANGHGGQLYDTIFQACLTDETILEVSVEDPSEAFDDLRDRRDLIRIYQDPEVKSLGKLSALPLDNERIEEMRRRMKISPRQFARLIEMRLQQTLSKNNKDFERAYKQLVKKRLYLKNKDVLIALSSVERSQKLEETYQAQIEDYRRIMQELKIEEAIAVAKTIPVDGTSIGALDDAIRQVKRQKVV